MKILKEEKKFRQKIKIKNAILLVLPIEEISLQPELSSPAHFRIQGGYPERHIHTYIGVVITGLYFSFLI